MSIKLPIKKGIELYGGVGSEKNEKIDYKDIASFVEYAQRRLHKSDEYIQKNIPGHGVAAGATSYFLYKSNYDLLYVWIDFEYNGTSSVADVYLSDSSQPGVISRNVMPIYIPNGTHYNCELIIKNQEQLYIINGIYPASENVIVTLRIIFYDKNILK